MAPKLAKATSRPRHQHKTHRGWFFLPDGPGPIAEADDFPSGLKRSPYLPPYPVFPIKFECVKTRLNKLPKGNTDANKAVRWEDIDASIVKTKRKITSCTRKTHRGGGNPAFTIQDKGFTYRLCYLEIASIIDSSDDEEEEI